jgi:hypothetical protein
MAMGFFSNATAGLGRALDNAAPLSRFVAVYGRPPDVSVTLDNGTVGHFDGGAFVIDQQAATPLPNQMIMSYTLPGGPPAPATPPTPSNYDPFITPGRAPGAAPGPASPSLVKPLLLAGAGGLLLFLIVRRR